MLWCTSGLAEFWALTLDERRRLLEVAIEEARATNTDVVIQACTSTTAAKDCVELTRHAQEAGADIVYIQTPVMETHGGDGDTAVYRAGWLRDGVVCAAQLGTAGYLFDTPARRLFTE